MHTLAQHVFLLYVIVRKARLTPNVLKKKAFCTVHFNASLSNFKSRLHLQKKSQQSLLPGFLFQTAFISTAEG